ncbi:MAG: hypothetical protein AAGA23_01060 [Pseudomonadota bacterium]
MKWLMPFLWGLASLAASANPDFSALLTGQFSGYEAVGSLQVDLKVQFFAEPSGGPVLAERSFQRVSITAGQFAVWFDPSGLAATPLFAEISIRPSERRYANYRTAGPRRAVELAWEGPRRLWRLRTPPINQPTERSS